MNRVSASIAHASQSTASRLTAFRSIASTSTASKYSSNHVRSWPPRVSPNTLNYGFQVHLCVHSISASICISKLARLRPPNSLDQCLQVHLQTRSITASKLARSQPPSASPNSLDYGIQTRSITASKLARSRPSSASPTCSITASKLLDRCLQVRTIKASKYISPNSLDHGLQVHLKTCFITACKYIFKERRRVYGDTAVTEVDSMTGSIYLADRGVHRHHLISISSFHTMKIHTLSFPTFSLTCSVRDFVDPRTCVDTQRRVVSYHLTRFLRSSNQNRSVS